MLLPLASAAPDMLLHQSRSQNTANICTYRVKARLLYRSISQPPTTDTQATSAHRDCCSTSHPPAECLQPHHAKPDGAAQAASLLPYRLQTLRDHVCSTQWQMPSISCGHHLYIQQHQNTCWPAVGFWQQAHAFLHAGPAAWNKLPPGICAAANPAIFKKLLRTHFSNTVFSTLLLVLSLWAITLVYCTHIDIAMHLWSNSCTRSITMMTRKRRMCLMCCAVLWSLQMPEV